MYIKYEQNTGENLQKTSLKEKFWQFIRFTVVTGAIFTISFVLINFTAYKQILATAINPDARAQAEKVLETASGNTKREVDQSKLLPVLPDKKEIRKSFSWIDFSIAPTDNRLVIPKLGKSIPLVNMNTEHIEGENWSDLEGQIQDGLRNGVVHYPGTARPGQFGNVFLTGHSSYYPWDSGKFKDVFALLGKLDTNDRFYVYYDQIKYTYQIYEKVEVQPSNVDVLSQPRDRKIATLMTCTPVGTALRRLIIKADQVS